MSAFFIALSVRRFAARSPRVRRSVDSLAYQDWTREIGLSPPATHRSVLRHRFAIDHNQCCPSHLGHLNLAAWPRAPRSRGSSRPLCAEAPPSRFRPPSSPKTNAQKGPPVPAERLSRLIPPQVPRKSQAAEHLS